MKTIFPRLALSILMLFSSNAYSYTEYTLGGSYSFSGINSFSDAGTLDFEISAVASVFYNETDELGLSFNYRINWEEDSYNRVTSETFQLSPSLFYRRHFLFFGKDSGLPVFLYLGPNVGIAKIRPSLRPSSFQLVAGLAWGFHIFLVKDASLDILIFNANKEFTTQKNLFNQGIGFRFYF